MPSPIQLIVGLGNPGAEYHRTRHNAGADLVIELARQCQATLKPESKFFGLTAKVLLNGKSIHLLIPTTFMNLSGKSVAALSQFYKIPTENILVAHDELDIDPGKARFKIGGGHGGHNGLKDIIKCHGNNNNFSRLRIGIGHPGNAKLVSGYVLKKAPEHEFTLIEDSLDNALRALPLAIEGSWDKAMQQLHTA